MGLRRLDRPLLRRHPPRSWLAHYADRFPAVEVNATFYRLPSVPAVTRWRERVHRIRFVVKGSRYLTHVRRLTDTADGLRRFFERLEPLGQCLDTVLWQLPRTSTSTSTGSTRSSTRCRRRTPHGRVPSHELVPDAYAVLDRHGALLVSVSGPQLPRGSHRHRWRRVRALPRPASGLLLRLFRRRSATVERSRSQRSGFAFFDDDIGGRARSTRSASRGCRGLSTICVCVVFITSQP